MAMVIGGVVMKNKSLFRKSMLWIIVPTLLVSLLLILVSKSVIENYFREESYDILYREVSAFEKNIPIAQARLEGAEIVPPHRTTENILPKWSPRLVPNKSVQSRFIVRIEDGHFRVIGEGDTSDLFELDQIIGNVTWPLEGETSLESEKIFYAIMPVERSEYLNRLRLDSSDDVYHIAYISETYSGDLTKVVMTIFIIGIIILLLIVSMILFYVFRHMTHRISGLEKGSSAIGKGDFATRLAVEPYDEIGRLGEAMNHMSRQLELTQEEQADQFQMISHELKTPIMVMGGYLYMLKHNQYPNGTKEATYSILAEELHKLDQLTQDIITLNKLDYLSKNKVEISNLSLRQLFAETADRMNLAQNIEISIEGEMSLVGDRESWVHVIENILTNNLRYAKSKIVIELGESIRIKNDGPPIEAHLLHRIMKPFVKGESGRSGLGLAIVSNILKLYHFKLLVNNCDDGVEYIIKKERL